MAVVFLVDGVRGPPSSLRRSVEDSIDTMWAIGSTEVLLLRSIQGWDADRFAAWLGAVLVDALLRPPAEA